MSNYTPSTDFAAKDALLSGNPAKVVKGTEFAAEFSAIQAAISSKYDSSTVVPVAAGGTGATTLSGVIKGNGTGAMTAAVAGTDYLAPAAIGTTVQAYDANTAKTNLGQQFTAAPYTDPLTDNDLSFDISAKLDFVCTPTAGGTLTFTNIRAGAKGDILFINNSNYAIAKAATVKASSSFLTTISTTGRYIISYRSLDGTNVDVVASAALS